MEVILKKFDRKRFEECGWKYHDINGNGSKEFVKTINGFEIFFAVDDDDYEDDEDADDEEVCELYFNIDYQLRANDFVAIANEVKKLEE
jgi:hypothetical protein